MFCWTAQRAGAECFLSQTARALWVTAIVRCIWFWIKLQTWIKLKVKAPHFWYYPQWNSINVLVPIWNLTQETVSFVNAISYVNSLNYSGQIREQWWWNYLTSWTLVIWTWWGDCHLKMPSLIWVDQRWKGKIYYPGLGGHRSALYGT